MKKTLICLTVLGLAACSDYANWDKRGPDATGAEPQKNLMLPPDFFLRAPVENSAPANVLPPEQTVEPKAAASSDDTSAPELTF